MDKGYNFYNLEASFKNWLVAGIDEPQKSLTKISVKNYLSDLRHFLGWLVFKLKVKSQKLKVEEANIDQILNFIDLPLIEEYKNYLVVNSIPIKTVNRRLSTLRKFFSFCINQGWIKENPAKKISNIKYQISNIDKDDVLNLFQQDLKKENLDQNTIKSYLETIQEFLSL